MLSIASRNEKVVESANGQRLIMLGSNDYLGLTVDPMVIGGAVEALHRYGTGLAMNQPFATTPLHQELRERIAAFSGMEGALVFGSCSAANIALIATLARERDATIFSDSDNHPSIIDGCELARGRTVVYQTCNTSDLESKIAAVPGTGARTIVSDGVFSIEGNLAPAALASIARRNGATLVLDESHAAGVVGATGGGTAEALGLDRGRDVTAVTGTFAKAFGAGSGGYVAGPVDLLAEVARTARFYIFNTGMNVAAAGAALAGIELAEHDTARRSRLAANASSLRAGLLATGLTVLAGDSPITTLLIGDDAVAVSLAQRLRQRGVIITAVASPIVPPGNARLRLQPSALHSADDIRCACDMIAELAADLQAVS